MPEEILAALQFFIWHTNRQKNIKHSTGKLPVWKGVDGIDVIDKIVAVRT
jgi:hypothetical protein